MMNIAKPWEDRTIPTFFSNLGLVLAILVLSAIPAYASEIKGTINVIKRKHAGDRLAENKIIWGEYTGQQPNLFAVKR